MQYRQLLVAGLVTFSGAAFGDAIEQYETVEELIEAHNDYHAENNTFEMLDASIPHYRLSKVMIEGTPDIFNYYENWRAAAYGIYNVFAHTPIESVSVTAVPYQVKNLHNQEEGQLLEDRSIDIEIKREQALDAMASLIDIDSLADVKTQTEYGTQWSENFLGIYYEHESPGLDALINELKPYCTNSCK
ncbi:hypothetical protein ACGLWX_08520 [Halomonas sp. HMF6819]|uniref:hypothetical protein n=1 Tax=Halomonas sp. HMF6819 TaxID=3373085 RepID=UPI0037AD2CDB